jgi:hypothetical protein
MLLAGGPAQIVGQPGLADGAVFQADGLDLVHGPDHRRGAAHPPQPHRYLTELPRAEAAAAVHRGYRGRHQVGFLQGRHAALGEGRRLVRLYRLGFDGLPGGFQRRKCICRSQHTGARDLLHDSSIADGPLELEGFYQKPTGADCRMMA